MEEWNETSHRIGEQMKTFYFSSSARRRRHEVGISRGISQALWEDFFCKMKTICVPCDDDFVALTEMGRLESTQL